MARLKINAKPSFQRLDLAAKGLVNTNVMGGYSSTFKGQGLEFSSYRAYSNGDDATNIDWTASSRARKLLVKEFVEERDIDIYFLVDVSSRMTLGTTSKLKAEYAAEIVSAFSNSALRAGDHVGLVMFADKISHVVRPEAGMKHFHVILDALSKVSNYGGGTNFTGAMEYALRNFKKNSIVILISDFAGNVDYEEDLKYMAKKFDLVGLMIQDPIDIELPEGVGQVVVQDPVTGSRMLISPKKLKTAYAKEVKKVTRDIDKMFRDASGDFLPLATNKAFGYELNAFFSRRRLEWK